MTSGTRLTRREFIKLTGLTGLLLAVDWKQAIRAMAETVRSGDVNIIWFEAQDCAGNTTALIQATDPDLLDILGGSAHLTGPGNVKLLFHETVMAEWGESALEILRKAEAGEYDPYVLVLEGSVPPDEKMGAPPYSDYLCYIGEENGKPVSCMEWMRRLVKRAVAVVTVGNCASYGGVVANRVLTPPPGFRDHEYYKNQGFSPSPTGGIGFFPDPIRGFKGLIDVLPEAEPFKRFAYDKCKPQGAGDPSCRPAIAVPGCPANGNAQLRVLANLVLWAKGLVDLPELDEYWRPKFIFGPTVHEQCPRAGSYAAGDFRETPGEPDDKCLFAVGCKGPISNCPWNKVGWVNGVGGPTRTGGVCIGCTMPGFTDSFEGFYKPLNAVQKVRTRELASGLAIAGAAGAALAFLAERSLRKKPEKSSGKEGGES
ncbi:MAG: hyaluronate lyase [Desulfurococcales archaeon]|nr:hyaluronate lyase [Desulfurococcales archaeon]